MVGSRPHRLSNEWRTSSLTSVLYCMYMGRGVNAARRISRWSCLYSILYFHLPPNFYFNSHGVKHRLCHCTVNSPIYLVLFYTDHSHSRCEILHQRSTSYHVYCTCIVPFLPSFFFCALLQNSIFTGIVYIISQQSMYCTGVS